MLLLHTDRFPSWRVLHAVRAELGADRVDSRIRELGGALEVTVIGDEHDVDAVSARLVDWWCGWKRFWEHQVPRGAWSSVA